MRQSHDQFAKECAAGMLEYIGGNVNIQHQLWAEVSYADLSFEPSATTTDIVAASQLGLFGKLAMKPCLMEFFKQQPTKIEIRSCLAKLFVYHGELLRRAKRKNVKPTKNLDNPRLAETSLPRLWIITTYASETLLNGFAAQLQPNEWGDGIYFLSGKALKTALIVLNRLPPTPETLWLRLLGCGPTQKQAAEELGQLPAGPLRDHLLELVYRFYVEIELKTTLTERDKELLMNISPVYQQARQQAVQEGRQQGRVEGRVEGRQQGRVEGRVEGRQQGRVEGQRIFVEHLLKSRFGKLDRPLSNVIDGVVQLPPEEVAPLLLQASREELIAKFKGRSSRKK